MKFYSEKTKTLYDTEGALKSAEAEIEAKKFKNEERRKERAEDAKRLEEAFKDAEKASKKAKEMLAEFCKKYGTYRTSISSPFTTFLDVLDAFIGF